MLGIRPEVPADRDDVFAVESAAFAQRNEAELVDAMRRSADPQLSLVATLAGEVLPEVVDPAFDPVFQVVELDAGALDGCRGRVRFHPAFAEV